MKWRLKPAPQIEWVEGEGKFSLGKVAATRAALRELSWNDIRDAIGRHGHGDWGDCSPEDREENELSLREGFRLFSVYHTAQGQEFWVITEADRSVTTVLLPEEY